MSLNLNLVEGAESLNLFHSRAMIWFHFIEQVILHVILLIYLLTGRSNNYSSHLCDFYGKISNSDVEIKKWQDDLQFKPQCKFFVGWVVRLVVSIWQQLHCQAFSWIEGRQRHLSVLSVFSQRLRKTRQSITHFPLFFLFYSGFCVVLVFFTFFVCFCIQTKTHR